MSTGILERQGRHYYEEAEHELECIERPAVQLQPHRAASPLEWLRLLSIVNPVFYYVVCTVCATSTLDFSGVPRGPRPAAHPRLRMCRACALPSSARTTLQPGIIVPGRKLYVTAVSSIILPRKLDTHPRRGPNRYLPRSGTGRAGGAHDLPTRARPTAARSGQRRQRLNADTRALPAPEGVHPCSARKLRREPAANA